MTLCEYVKCVWANKITTISYAIMTSSYPLSYLENDKWAYAALTVGFCVGAATAFSANTYIAYKRSQKSIRKHNHLPKQYNEKYALDYCTQVGVNLAKSEANKQLKKQNNPK
jgi:hypothetical protein